jgi:photosystem II stability/assembly factor-like uncharacterized protein
MSMGPLAILITIGAACSLAADLNSRPALYYSRGFGGHDRDKAIAVAVDSAGNSYLAAFTTSNNFPIRNALQNQIAGTPLRATADGGKTWIAPRIDAGVRSIASSTRVVIGLLFAGTSNGLYQSLDSGRTWPLIAAMAGRVVYSVITDPIDSRVVHVLSDSGIFESEDDGATWSDSNNGVPQGHIQSGQLIGTEGGTLLALLGQSLFRSTDSGATWTAVDGVPSVPVSIAVDPSNSNTLYALSFSGVFGSTNLGDSWTKLAPTIPGVSQTPQSLAVSSKSLYASTAAGIFRSLDRGRTWTATQITAPANVVLSDPANPNVVYANADRLYVSNNGGSDWSPILSPVPDTIQMLSLIPTSPTPLFVGSDLLQDIFVTKLVQMANRSYTLLT